VIVVEGYMDVIALSQAGIHECVAPLGTALTEHQIERLWKMADVPVLCFDGDTAGQKAADRAALRALPLLAPGRSLDFVTLPQGMDPDDLVKAKGAAGLEACLAASLPLAERLWQHERDAAPATTPEARAGLQQRLAEHATTIANELVRREYERSFKDRFWTEFGWKRQERAAVRGFISRSRDEIRNGDLSNMGARIERMVKRAILLGLSRYPGLLYTHREQFAALVMPTQTLQDWAGLLIRASFERASLESSLIDSILQDASLPEPERRDISYDLGFSFFRADAEKEMAENDLGEVINILLFEQEFAPKLERLKASLYARGGGDAPLIDLNEASIKKLIARGPSARRDHRYDELNEALPQDQMSSDQIEDIMSAINEMGVNIVENDEDGEDPEEKASTRSRRIDASGMARRAPSSRRRRKPSTAPTIRCACTCAKWARSNCSAAKAKSPSPSASRPAATP
jgi:DNA primase